MSFEKFETFNTPRENSESTNKQEKSQEKHESPRRATIRNAIAAGVLSIAPTAEEKPREFEWYLDDADHPAVASVLEKTEEGVQGECHEFLRDEFETLAHTVQHEWSFTLEKRKDTWYMSQLTKGGPRYVNSKETKADLGREVLELCDFHIHPLLSRYQVEEDENPAESSEEAMPVDESREEQAMEQVKAVQNGEIMPPFEPPSWQDTVRSLSYHFFRDIHDSSRYPDLESGSRVVIGSSGTWHYSVDDIEKLLEFSDEDLAEKEDQYIDLVAPLINETVYPPSVFGEFQNGDDSGVRAVYEARLDRVEEITAFFEDLGISMTYEPYHDISLMDSTRKAEDVGYWK